MQSPLIAFLLIFCGHVDEAIKSVTSTSLDRRDRLQLLHAAISQFALSLEHKASNQHIASAQSAISSVLEPAIRLSWPPLRSQPPSDALVGAVQPNIVSDLINPELSLFLLPDDRFDACMNRIKAVNPLTDQSSDEYYSDLGRLKLQSRRANDEETVLGEILSSQIPNNLISIDPNQKRDYLRMPDTWNGDEGDEYIKFEVLFKNRQRRKPCEADCLHETEIHVQKHREGSDSSKRKNADESIEEFTLHKDHISKGHGLRLLFSIEEDSTGYSMYSSGHENRLLRETDTNNSVSISSPLSDLEQLQKIKPLQKIALAYAVSLSFWRCYHTQLMPVPWTSQDIHMVTSLMQQTLNSKKESVIEPKYRKAVEFTHPYVAVRISRAGHIAEPQIYERSRKSYYPFIIALGVTLLEIWTGRLFRPSTLGQVCAENAYDYRLEGLQCLLDPDGIYSKSLPSDYAKAVKSCFHSSNWHLSNHDARRSLLYQEVVQPLEKLFHAVFLSENPQIPSGMAQASLDDEEYNPYLANKYHRFLRGVIDKFPSQDKDTRKAALAAEKVLKDEFLDMHSTIFTVDVMENLKPVRICVLDTGCDENAHYFKEFPADKNRITWTDYVENRSVMVDVDEGKHGTDIATLLLMLLPHARIYVSRITGQRNDFKQSTMIPTICDNATKALNDARHLHHADIVCMSWGLGRSDEGISNAIHEARSEMIFFAATNNQGRREAPLFPSNIEPRTGVIPVRGADAKDNKVPDYCPDSSRQFPPYLMALSQKVPCGYSLMDGCSVAVPIMAATAAMILQSVSIMQTNNPALKRRFKEVYSERGMREIFEKSFQGSTDGYQCIRPGRIFTQEVLQDIQSEEKDWYCLETKISGPLNSLRELR